MPLRPLSFPQSECTLRMARPLPSTPCRPQAHLFTPPLPPLPPPRSYELLCTRRDKLPMFWLAKETLEAAEELLLELRKLTGAEGPAGGAAAAVGGGGSEGGGSAGGATPSLTIPNTSWACITCGALEPSQGTCEGKCEPESERIKRGAVKPQ
jgi:hypothetical protein